MALFPAIRPLATRVDPNPALKQCAKATAAACLTWPGDLPLGRMMSDLTLDGD